MKILQIQIILSCRHVCTISGEKLKTIRRKKYSRTVLNYKMSTLTCSFFGLLFNDGAALSVLSLFSVSVSDTSQSVCCQLAPVRYLNVIQCYLSSNRDADNIGPAAVPLSPPPLPPPLRCTPSSGLLLYAEGNKDTRRISVVRLTKWLPETERAMPMGSTATSRSCAPFRRSPPPPCLGFPKVRSLSGSSVDMR